ncbi:HNH endonuclease signature motif containing protein [Actinospica robiniae]|uniref:HNH endonuclease signature motif containing protein n=1 Tax=Actinospica robiniae TaxID=304901 RepID=UPI000429E4D4|nr:HNH endonuclease signature motif containing protein [Actinospica robiniae]
MDGVAVEIASMSRVVREVLERARAGGDDVGRVDAVREAIVEVGRAAQALHGMLLTLVGEGDRLGIARGGVGPWLATVLDVTEGRARALAHDARLLARLPGVEAELCSGVIGPDSARALARTVKAVRATGLDPAEEAAKTLEVTRERGARAGLERVRVLEEQVAPGSIEARHARERERSFARISTCGEGQMHRCEILLDPVRGAVFQAAIDLQVAEMIRTRQFDGGEIVPGDVRSTEQMNAEAVTRLAQVFLDAPPEQRHAHFSLPALAVTIQDPTAPAAAVKNPAGHAAAVKDPSAHVAGMKDPAVHADIPAGCARTVFGALVPAGRLPRRSDPRRHELVTDGCTGTFDGIALDRDPRARLASPGQRGFLAWRDRYCTYPGCDRPMTFALHAHHIVPFAQGGETRVGNLRLYCAKHHTTVHQER